MAKPKRIVLVRHGESEGNVDRSIYRRMPDYAVSLTAVGREQARVAGQKLAQLCGQAPAAYYVSPFYRTRQTAAEMQKFIPAATVREDPRLREQEWSGNMPLHLRKEDMEEMEKERDLYGTLFYRFHGGESCADVYDRISTFLESLHRDFAKSVFPDTAIIVTHGMALRVFLMRWFTWITVEKFELMANPENGCRIVMEKKSGLKDRYEINQDAELIDSGIISKLRFHENPRHPYRMPI